ncbi:MAG: YitT family protein [Candidatus Cryptobacteroides sp.]
MNINEPLRAALAALRTSRFWKEFLLITLGMLLSAMAVYYFLMPANLIIGTVSGLAIVLSGVLAAFGIQIKVSLMVTIINVILIVLALLLLGKDFGIKTIYASLILGPMMDLCELVMPYEKLIAPGTVSVMGDLWFDLMCFVILLSISQALLFNINASTGGLDIIAKIINKYLHMDIGASVTLAGFATCITAFAINPFRLVIIGLLGTWLNGIVVNFFTATLNRRKRVCVVSKEHERIRKFIVESLGRGCSLYPLVGGYTGEQGMEVQALLTQDEFANLMELIRRENISAFVTASNISEVYGLWLKPKKFHF